MAKTYTVFVDDNFHYMDESERYKLGEFADCASAVAACKQIVDEFLTTCNLDANTDAEIYHHVRYFWRRSLDQQRGFRVQVLRLELRAGTGQRTCPEEIKMRLSL